MAEENYRQRAVVRFTSPIEAHRALRYRHNQFLMSGKVYLSVVQ